MKSLLKMHLMEDDANVVIGQEGDQLVAQYDGATPSRLGMDPRLKAKATAERDAAAAEVERLVTQADDAVPAGYRIGDAEEEVLRLPADIRAAVLGKLDDAPDLDTLRALLRRIFKKITLVEVNGRLRLCPEIHSDHYVVHDFYREHGHLPDPFGFEGYGDSGASRSPPS